MNEPTPRTNWRQARDDWQASKERADLVRDKAALEQEVAELKLYIADLELYARMTEQRYSQSISWQVPLCRKPRPRFIGDIEEWSE